MNDTFWTYERDGDSRRPIPAVGTERCIYDRKGDRTVYARCVQHGTLRTQVGGNDRACEWEVFEPARMRRDGSFVRASTPHSNDLRYYGEDAPPDCDAL